MILSLVLSIFLLVVFHVAVDGKDSKPFYPPGCAVKDLTAEAFEAIVSEGRQKMLVVFYAGWCGHCQHFAPVYIKTAEANPDAGFTFAAVDCVKHRDLCTENKVNSYPTIRGFGFGKEIEDDLWRKDIHTIYKVETFIKEFRSMREPKSLRGRVEKKDPAKEVVPPPSTDSEERLEPPPSDIHIGDANNEWVNKTVQSLARIASPNDRLHDALVSLRFLVQMEVLAQLNDPEAKNDVATFLKFVINLLPEHHQDPFLRFLVWMNSVDAISSAVVDEAAADAFGDAYNDWQVCGVPSNGPVRKVDGLFHHAQQGYLCGLWMLFHHLTVAAEERFVLSISEVLSSSSKDDTITITTVDVMENIHLCVDKFFNCRHCRTHFLHTYSVCQFGRCEVKKSEFGRLQLWLWNFHNYVTESILHYHISEEAKSRKGLEYYYKEVVSWPDHNRCINCYDRSSDSSRYNSSPANKYLRDVYWDKNWKLHTVRNFVPEYAHALRNPFQSSKAQHRRPASTSNVPRRESKDKPYEDHSNEDNLFTLGVVSLLGILLLAIVALYLSSRKRSNTSLYRRSRLSVHR